MIKILVFVFGVLVSIENLVDIEMESRQASFLWNVMYFLSGVSFAPFLSLYYLRQKITETVCNDFHDFISRVRQNIQ